MRLQNCIVFVNSIISSEVLVGLIWALLPFVPQKGSYPRVISNSGILTDVKHVLGLCTQPCQCYPCYHIPVIEDTCKSVVTPSAWRRFCPTIMERKLGVADINQWNSHRLSPSHNGTRRFTSVACHTPSTSSRLFSTSSTCSEEPCIWGDFRPKPAVFSFSQKKSSENLSFNFSNYSVFRLQYTSKH